MTDNKIQIKEQIKVMYKSTQTTTGKTLKSTSAEKPVELVKMCLNKNLFVTC